METKATDPKPGPKIRPGESKAELGVLLVHGIGEHRRGDVLTRWAQALIGCLRDWLGSLDPSVDIRVASARVDPSAEPGDEPACCEVVLDGISPARAEGSRRWGPSSRWLIAESWWARSFSAPSYWEFALRTLSIGPATIVSHFDRSLRRFWFQLNTKTTLRHKAYKVALLGLGLLRLLAALAALPLLLAVVLVLLVLGMIPGPVRSLAVGVQRFLSAYLGDSLILVGNDVVAAAIYDRVATDLRWLSDRSERVAVLAHSQGGAIAHAVLRAGPRAPCDLLLTFGSGLRKLSEIRRAEDVGGRGWLMAAISGIWAVGAGVGLGYFDRPGWGLAVGTFGLMLAGVSYWKWQLKTGRSWAAEEQRRADRVDFDDRFRLPDEKLRWIDVFSSEDLVPNGPLLDQLSPGTLESVRIENHGSLLGDHTAYLGNRDQFLWRTAGSLLGLCGLEPERLRPRTDAAAAPSVVKRQEAAAARRTWRVHWSRLLRRLVLYATALLLWKWWGGPPAWLEPLIGTVNRWIGRVPLVGPALAGGAGAEIWSAGGLVLVLGGALVAYVLGHGAWLLWDGAESRRALRGRPASWRDPLGLLVAAVWLMLCAGVSRLLEVDRALFGWWPAPVSSLVFAVAVLAALYFLWLALRGVDLRPVQGLIRLAAAGPVEKVVAGLRELEEARWQREVAAGSVEALLQLGWEAQRQAKEKEPGTEDRKARLNAAAAYFEKAFQRGQKDRGWYLGQLGYLWSSEYFELRERRRQVEEGGAMDGGRGARRDAGSRSDAARDLRAGEDEARRLAIGAFRRALEAGYENPRLDLGRLLALGTAGDKAEAEKVLRGAEDDGACAAELGRLLLDDGPGSPERDGEAREVLLEAVERGRSDCLVGLARLARREGDVRQAEALYRQALARGVEGAAVPLAELLLEEGWEAEAEEVLAGAVERGVVEAALRLGDLRASGHRPAEAAAAYERALELGEDRSELARAAIALADLRGRTGDVAGRDAELLAAAKRYGSAEAALVLGELRRERGEAGAREAFDMALEIARRHGEPWYVEDAELHLAELRKSEDREQAAAALSRVAGELGSVRAALELGKLREEQGHRRSARAAFGKAFELARAQKDAWPGIEAAFALARLQRMLGQEPAAAQTLAAAERDFGPAFWLARSERLERRHDLDGAAEATRRGLEEARARHSPEQVSRAAVELARLESRRGRFERAEDVLAEAMDSSGSAGAALELGAFRFESGDWDGALTAYRRALDLARSSEDSGSRERGLLAIAELHEQMGELDRAEATLAGAVRKMSSPEAALRLARLHAGRGRASETLAWCRRALDLARSRRRWRVEGLSLEVAEVYREIGETERAEQLLVAQARESRSARLALELADRYRDEGRLAEAVAWYRSAVRSARRHGDSREAARASISLAEVHRRLGEDGRAAEVLRVAASELDSCEAAVELGDLHAGLGERDEALRAFARAVELADSAGDRGFRERAVDGMARLEDALEPVRRTDPGAWRAAADRARTLEAEGNHDGALRAYRQALARARSAGAGSDGVEAALAMARLLEKADGGRMKDLELAARILWAAIRDFGPSAEAERELQRLREALAAEVAEARRSR